MLTLYRDGFVRAFVIGFVVAGVPMAVATGLFS